MAAPQAVIAGLVAVVNVSRSAGMKTFDDIMNGVQYNDHKQIWLKYYVPFITDQDLVNFIQTGVAKFKKGFVDQGSIINDWNKRTGAINTYTTFDPNEALVLLADTPEMPERIQTLAKNGYQSVNAEVTSEESWFSKYWLYMLALLAILFLLFRKKRRKRK